MREKILTQMKNKKNILLGVLIGLILFIIYTISTVEAVEVSYCCEKTKTTGVWCQNEPLEKCDANYRKAPTSCEATSFCKLGTCINVQEGICMENTPERTCNEDGGFWKSEKPEDITQCKLGCCVMGDQAAFVTQTRCKKISSVYGLETNFRNDISSEIECIASAGFEENGACVFEKEFEKTCKMLTRKECKNYETKPSETSSSILKLFNTEEGEVVNVKFYLGLLCSNENLSTNCGPTKKTTCLEEKDEVYFLDSCGNTANIYDASKADDPNYWSEIKPDSEICRLTSSNQRVCGNCDYYSGSTCRKSERADRIKPVYGDNICKDLSCTWQSQKYKHGETWCAQSAGTSFIEVKDNEILEKDIDLQEENLPGSRYFRLVCYNGEVTIEPCAEYRQEVCMQGELNGFKTSACRKNRWETCPTQDNEKDCLNTEKRDCLWINSGNLKSDLSDDDKKELNEKIIDTLEINEEKYFEFVCIPKYSPGFDFWSENTDAKDICELASSSCLITYEARVLHKVDKTREDCKEDGGNCYCLPDDGPWLGYKENLCLTLGDCGIKKNYLNQIGYKGFWSELIKRTDK